MEFQDPNNNYPIFFCGNLNKNSKGQSNLFSAIQTRGGRVGLSEDSPPVPKMDENGSLERLQEIVLAVKAGRFDDVDGFPRFENILSWKGKDRKNN